MPKSLGDMVREKLDAAVLPIDEPVKLWAGLGTGKLCTVCERPILQAQSLSTTTDAPWFASTRDAMVCGKPSCIGVVIVDPSRRRIIDIAHRHKAD